MATRGDLVPDLYLTRFRTLEDACPAAPAADIKATVVRELGLDSLGEVFREFDDTPLGSASIGQVHRAVLNNGKVVCVKVQHVGVERLFRFDINTCRFFCKCA
jgi:predicted unusual protein kinase regulating ubiquinone biosynthesis (AarF/ABC1/UbiB family)